MAQVYAHVNMFASPAGDLDLVSFEEALKEHYHGQQVTDLVYKNRPLLALLPKYTKMGGRVMPVPVMSANPQNRSATFTAAQKTGAALGPNQYQPSQIQSFLLTRDRDYSIARVDGETLDASKGDSNAFMQAATAEIDGAMSAISRSLCHALYPRWKWCGLGFGRCASGCRPPNCNQRPCCYCRTNHRDRSRNASTG